jgi:hypothetical protein
MGLISIMGRPYLTALVHGQLENSTSSIPISRKPICGLQFALGRFGLQGVRVSYQDGSHSLWLGTSSACWIGTVYSSDLSKLSVVKDVSDVLWLSRLGLT